jgi:hypothetical protein
MFMTISFLRFRMDDRSELSARWYLDERTTLKKSSCRTNRYASIPLFSLTEDNGNNLNTGGSEPSGNARSGS